MSIETHPYAGTTPRVSGSDTSEAAGDSALPFAGTLRGDVLESIKDWPKTDEEIQNSLSLSPSTERPRRRELVLLGYVRDSGWRRTTVTGRQAIVWEAVEGRPSPYVPERCIVFEPIPGPKVEAFHYLGVGHPNFEELREWLGDDFMGAGGHTHQLLVRTNGHYSLYVNPGNWIVRNEDGGYTSYTHERFTKDYRRAK